MAGLTTHIALTEKVFTKLFTDYDKPGFIVGTSFPDIRYLNVVEREQTHLSNITLEDIKNEPNSFMAGFKFHSLVDEVRERFIVSKGVYDLLPSSRLTTQALKIYEDRLLFNKINGQEEVAKYFDRILPEELEFDVPEIKISEWHQIIQKWLVSNAQSHDVELVMSKLGFDGDSTNEVLRTVEYMEDVPLIKETSDRLYDEIEVLIQKT